MLERRHTVLIVDDDPGILEALRLSLELDYEVLVAPGGAEGLELLARNEVALIIADQRMPGMMGVEFLERAREVSPNSVRMMLTGFADLDAIVGAINRGQVYRYISKPWEPKDLEIDVRQAVETYDMRVALDRRMRELKMLCEVGAAITSVLDLDQDIQMILEAVVNTLGFERSFLMLVDEGAGVLRSRACAGVSDEARAFFLQLEYGLDREDVAVVLTVRQNRSILVEDVDDAPVGVDREVVRRMGVRSFVTVPLVAGERKIGVLVADRSGAGERVVEHDRLLLMGFANQAAIALENARLYGEALEKQRLEQELAAAGRIQQLLLPQALPEVEGFDISGTSRPSRGVSGDYYDVVEDRSGRVWVALGDVSGKGMPAALTMATLRALFRSELEREQSLAEAMRRIGEGLWRCTAPEVFATFCFGALDPEERAFTFVNAGHPYPLLIRADGSPPSPAGTGSGLPVGVDPTLAGVSPYLEQRVDMRSGDVFVIYSDGVTEAGAGDGEVEMFGEERLEAVLVEHRTKDAAAVQEAICSAVSAFLGDAPPGDDLTLVVIRAK
ncbi:MAG: hypothetical protein A3F84_11790 [Candidatus Handelsmanbacteria bacterium RIFCSPLOWO2_12_FULL_64_10]|uniref:Response regulatory domain-containing protein n=1 Tax=Handelsmanbacteria sp. (strain RIFCSPLOWO2_12_FULL_64_10) TaxID=1817868 RepID=A0A1F6C7R9_HANXR|nr:MAG: hypothetical protein A3F84_11790 [Candidatus Handelsmanbacteria bacterium RIFCSPLOWO2_12_FULL_64_10]